MALASAIEWEVRVAGADTSGGGFKTGATGTDRSQQDAAHATLSAASVVHTTTTQINVSAGDFIVSAADVGNVLQVTGGTATAGFYEITAADVGNNRWTMDRAVGTAAQTVVGAMGGALATPGKAIAAMVKSNITWIRGGAYNVAANITSTAAAATPGNDAPNRIFGYGTVRGDLGRPVLTASGACTIVIAVTNTGWWIQNLEIDCNSVAGKGTVVPQYSIVGNCDVREFTVSGIELSGSFSSCVDCIVRAGITGATAAINGTQSAGVYGCVVYGNACPGAIVIENSAVSRCLIYGNSGASSDGIRASYRATIINNVVHGNGRDGMRIADFLLGQVIRDNIFTDNGGYGMNYTGAAALGNPAWNANAFRGNTSGARNGFVAGAQDVTLSADPFANAAGGDFALNTTAGGGAACRAAGIPGVFPGGLTTGYLDIGAAQHADAGGGGVFIHTE